MLYHINQINLIDNPFIFHKNDTKNFQELVRFVAYRLLTNNSIKESIKNCYLALQPNKNLVPENLKQQ